MTQALIAFGANLGDVQSSLDEAVARIADHTEIEVVAVAKPLVTTAVSGEEGDNEQSAGPSPDYLNSAIRVATKLTAEALFQFTSRLEQEMGRQRKKRWGSRTIDLDIILFGDQIIDDPQLQVPHPRMSFRKFVLGPASEIAGEMIDPISGVSLNGLTERLHRSSERILWIAGDEKAAQILVAEVIAGSRRSGWGFRVAGNIEEVAVHLRDFRLLLFSAPEQRFRDAALRFAGPWLNLNGLRRAQYEREIRAAIEAMTLA